MVDVDIIYAGMLARGITYLIPLQRVDQVVARLRNRRGHTVLALQEVVEEVRHGGRPCDNKTAHDRVSICGGE